MNSIPIEGMSAADKMKLIVRIQAWVRGARTRIRVRQQYGFVTSFGNFGSALEPNYDNATVQNIRQSLKDYNYEENAPATDNEQREYRDVVTLENGARYEGEWSMAAGVRDGRGEQVWADGSLYEGYWRGDKANGHGRLIHADGDVYMGEWKDDKAHGFGRYMHTDGARYEGLW